MTKQHTKYKCINLYCVIFCLSVCLTPVFPLSTQTAAVFFAALTRRSDKLQHFRLGWDFSDALSINQSVYSPVYTHI